MPRIALLLPADGGWGQLCTAPDCPNPADLPLCPSCTGQLRADLRAVPELIDELTVTVTRQDAVTEPGGRGRAEHPLLYRPDAADVGRDLHAVLFAWARHLLEAAGADHADLHPTSRPDIRAAPVGPARAPVPGQITWPGPSLPEIGRFPGRPTIALARWLERHLGQASEDPAAGQLAAEITDGVARCWHAIDRPGSRRYLGRCGCHTDQNQLLAGWATELWAAPRATRVTCRACDTAYDVQTRQRELLKAALPLRVTAELASRALPVLLNGTVEITPDLIRGWVRDHGLIRHPPVRHDPHHRPRYRIGDLVDLAVARAQRVNARQAAPPVDRLPTEVAALFARVRDTAAAHIRSVSLDDTVRDS